MKNTLTAAIIGALSVVSVNAATTITATNSGGTATRQIQTSLGDPLTAAEGGVYEIGVFAGNTFSVSTTLADFTSAGSLAFSGTQPGVFGSFTSPANGIVVELPNDGDAAGTFVNRPIYVVIRYPGVNPDGKFIAFSTPNTFAFESALNAGVPVSITNANLTLIRGTVLVDADTGLSGALAGANGVGDAITFVPEPSAALLGAFGVLGLLRRRRN